VPPGSAEDKRWNELCAKLPVRYSPHVGLVFDNLMPDARDASPRWAASSRVLELEGKSSPATAYYSRKRPVGAVVKAVVAGGPVALRMAAMPPTHPGWVGGGGGGVGGGGAGSAASRNLAVDEGQRVVEPGDVLVDVDGQDVDDSVSLSRVLQLLAGEAGTPVTLMFRRYSSAGGGSTLIARNFLTVFRAPSAATAASRANADSQTCQPQREIGDGSEGRDGISISTCKDPSVVRFAYANHCLPPPSITLPSTPWWYWKIPAWRDLRMPNLPPCITLLPCAPPGQCPQCAQALVSSGQTTNKSVSCPLSCQGLQRSVAWRRAPTVSK
jgi:hypothetical protein